MPDPKGEDYEPVTPASKGEDEPATPPPEESIMHLYPIPGSGRWISIEPVSPEDVMPGITHPFARGSPSHPEPLRIRDCGGLGGNFTPAKIQTFEWGKHKDVCKFRFFGCGAQPEFNQRFAAVVATAPVVGGYGDDVKIVGGVPAYDSDWMYFTVCTSWRRPGRGISVSSFIFAVPFDARNKVQFYRLPGSDLKQLPRGWDDLTDRDVKISATRLQPDIGSEFSTRIHLAANIRKSTYVWEFEFSPSTYIKFIQFWKAIDAISSPTSRGISIWQRTPTIYQAGEKRVNILRTSSGLGPENRGNICTSEDCSCIVCESGSGVSTSGSFILDEADYGWLVDYWIPQPQAFTITIYAPDLEKIATLHWQDFPGLVDPVVSLDFVKPPGETGILVRFFVKPFTHPDDSTPAMNADKSPFRWYWIEIVEPDLSQMGDSEERARYELSG